jgi:hypothetical protein
MREAQLKISLCGRTEKEIKMRNMSKLLKVAIESLLVLGFVMSGSIPVFSKRQE